MKGTEKNLATLDSRAGARALVDVADWISTESWEGYEAMRVTLGKPMTDHVRKLTIEQLAELRDQGQDPNAVLDQSTLHGWISLIAVKPNGNGTPPASKPETPDEYWERRMCDYDRYGNWLSFDGPPPGQHGCRVPQGILDAHAQRASAHGRQAPRTGG